MFTLLSLFVVHISVFIVLQSRYEVMVLEEAYPDLLLCLVPRLAASHKSPDTKAQDSGDCGRTRFSFPTAVS